MKLYLITGFLGAGKTTFLKNFIQQFNDKKLWLIINDFGKVGVDGALLEKVNAIKSEISNGSIFCACRLDKFEEALQEAIEDTPDIILVEASGLADPTGVEKVIGQPEFAKIDYKGSICLIDTPRLEKVIHTARVLPKQIKVSSLVLLNKIDISNHQQITDAKEAIKQLNPLATIVETKFGAFNSSWLTKIYPLISGNPDNLPDIQLQKHLVLVDESMSYDQLYNALKILAEESWRIKGFVILQGKKYLVNCVGPSIKMVETLADNNTYGSLVLLAGPGMQLRKAIQEAIKWYPQFLRE